MRSISKQEYPELRSTVLATLHAYVYGVPQKDAPHRFETNPWIIFNLVQQLEILETGLRTKTRRQLKNLAIHVRKKVTPDPKRDDDRAYKLLNQRQSREVRWSIDTAIEKMEDLLRHSGRNAKGVFYKRFVKKLSHTAKDRHLGLRQSLIYRAVADDLLAEITAFIKEEQEHLVSLKAKWLPTEAKRHSEKESLSTTIKLNRQATEFDPFALINRKSIYAAIPILRPVVIDPPPQ